MILMLHTIQNMQQGLTPKQILQRLSIPLAQVKADKN